MSPVVEADVEINCHEVLSIARDRMPRAIGEKAFHSEDSKSHHRPEISNTLATCILSLN